LSSVSYKLPVGLLIIGLLIGASAGYFWGQSVGYNTGYETGYQTGYDEGFEAGKGAAPPPKLLPVTLKFASFHVGGGWYVMAGAMAEAIKKELPEGSLVDVVPTGGGVVNVKLIDSGEMDLGFTFGLNERMAWLGQEPYDKEYRNIRLVAARLDTYWNGIAIGKDVAERYGITSIEDIKNKKIGLKLVTSTIGGNSEFGTKKILEAYGITYDDLRAWGGEVYFERMGTAAAMIKDRRADAMGWMVTPGHPTWTDIFTARDMVWLPVTGEAMKKMVELGWFEGKIPAGTFKGMEEDVPLPQTATELIVRADLSDELVYLITKAIVERRGEIVAAYKPVSVWNPEETPNVALIDLHPGAIKYYKEKGWM
jgi:hypothetical protein